MDCLHKFATPQLARLPSGKVRDSFRVDAGTRLMVATDRISAFDQVLQPPVPGKGAVLTGLSAHWFRATQDLVPNHLIEVVDPQAMLVREAEPIRLEVIVRGYLTGSMWRGYERGKRVFSGASVPDGLGRNARLPAPLLTPTTKGGTDREISPAEIVSDGRVSAATWSEIERVSLELFQFGSEMLARRGLLLVDTKYEFGLVDGQLTLIDELHTPDSSRFWSSEEWHRDPAACEGLDKEYVRRWLLEHTVEGKQPEILPADVVEETSRRYLSLFHRVTGGALEVGAADLADRMYANLVRAKVIRDGFVAVFMGSPADLPYCQNLKEMLERLDLAVDLRLVSAHKNGEDIAGLAEEYNLAFEPGAAIAVAGLSNGLGGALAANLGLPVINCPPFKDQMDFLVNINSSLAMPSKVAVATVVGPEAAVLAAARALNLRRLRERFVSEMAQVKAQLRAEDRRIRGR